MSEWISVKDRLPSEWDEYLVGGIDYGVGMASYYPPRNEWNAEYFDEKQITHWMPLPPAPEKDK